MNNCRAGLYSFTSTTTWLHEIGIASPPLLVTLGLTLPDSRMLNGIASTGLTLANIAIILPHLRQPVLDSIHPLEDVLVYEQSTKKQTIAPPDRFNAAQPVDLVAGSPVLASVPPSKEEHKSPPLACSATVKSVYTADTEPLGCTNVEFDVAPHTILLRLTTKTNDDHMPPHVLPSLDADTSEMRVSPSHLFAREGRGALYIPLPVPDAEEVAFFDTEEDNTLSNSDPDERCSAAAWEQHADFEEHSIVEDDGLTFEEVCIHNVSLLPMLMVDRVLTRIVNLS